jgi:hypothetical protein
MLQHSNSGGTNASHNPLIVAIAIAGIGAASKQLRISESFESCCCSIPLSTW